MGLGEKNEDYFVKRSVSDAEKESKDTTEREPTFSSRRIYPDGNSDKGHKKNTSTKAVTESQNSDKLLQNEKKEVKDRNLLIKIPPAFRVGNVDMVFLVVLILLLAFGTIMTFSASYVYADKKYGDSYYFVERHLLFAVLGVVAILGIMMFPIKTYRYLSYIIFGLAIILLLLVLIIGSTRGGAKRWIEIPGLGSFQPSELGKTAVVMMLALYMSKYFEEISSKKKGTAFIYGILIPGAIVLLIGGLVVLERHFSGLIIIGFLGVLLMIIGGSKMRFIVPMAVVAGVVLVVAILSTGYSSSRLEIYQDPWSDPTGEGWQTIQGLYSIASGGIFGVGLGNSRQKYGYVSEPQNDFIFTIVCEELGFIGALAVIALFLILIWRGFVIARHSPNRFTYLIVLGFVIKIAIQVGLNIAVVTKTIPNTGISLPFFSAGGTSLLVQMAEMGMVLSISRYSRQKK